MNTANPLVRMALPLNTWILQKVCGPVLNEPHFWKAVALSFVPPPQNLINVINREWGDPDSPALLSPSYRRRLRNQRKHYLERQLHNNPLAPAVQGHLLQWRQEMEAAGNGFDPARIRKLREIETNEYYSRLTEDVAPPSIVSEEKVDGEALSPVVLGPLSAKEARDIMSLLYEFAVYGEGGNKPKIRRTSGIWKALGIDPDRLAAMSSEEGLLFCLSRFEALLGLRGQPLEEQNLLRLLRWVIKTHLPSDRELGTTPKARIKAEIAGLIHRAIKVRDEESGEVVQVDVEDKSVVQPEDMLDLDDEERLWQFVELAGIDLNEFTHKEQERMLDLLDFFETDNKKSAKVGISFKDYYGDRADSEKTQRARLFQKIRTFASLSRLKN